MDERRHGFSAEVVSMIHQSVNSRFADVEGADKAMSLRWLGEF